VYMYTGRGPSDLVLQSRTIYKIFALNYIDNAGLGRQFTPSFYRHDWLTYSGVGGAAAGGAAGLRTGPGRALQIVCTKIPCPAGMNSLRIERLE